jgi:hypothetical protein
VVSTFSGWSIAVESPGFKEAAARVALLKVGNSSPQSGERQCVTAQWSANSSGKLLISRAGSRVSCYVIPANEELMIARLTLRVMRAHHAIMLEEKRA